MKKLLFILMLPLGIAAPAAEPAKILLFSQFEKGSVVLKEHYAKMPATLNYDLIEERMLYLESDSSLNELDAAAVAAVVIGAHSFFPAGKNQAFYERIEAGTKDYYIRHKTKTVSKGKAAGYGSYSQTASVGGLAVSTTGGNLYLLGPDEQWEGVDESSVLIANGKKWEKITSLKNVVKCFKPHQTAIETYANEHKTNFNHIDDVKAIIEYALSL